MGFFDSSEVAAPGAAGFYARIKWRRGDGFRRSSHVRIDVKQDNFCMRILDSTNRWVRHAGREAGLSKDNMTCLRALDSLLEHSHAFWIFREYADSYPMHDCKSDRRFLPECYGQKVTPPSDLCN